MIQYCLRVPSLGHGHVEFPAHLHLRIRSAATGVLDYRLRVNWGGPSVIYRKSWRVREDRRYNQLHPPQIPIYTITYELKKHEQKNIKQHRETPGLTALLSTELLRTSAQALCTIRIGCRASESRFSKVLKSHSLRSLLFPEDWGFGAQAEETPTDHSSSLHV